MLVAGIVRLVHGHMKSWKSAEINTHNHHTLSIRHLQYKTKTYEFEVSTHNLDKSYLIHHDKLLGFKSCPKSVIIGPYHGHLRRDTRDECIRNQQPDMFFLVRISIRKGSNPLPKCSTPSEYLPSFTPKRNQTWVIYCQKWSMWVTHPLIR